MRGFTLVELLVSVIIVSFLMMGIFMILNIGNMTYNSDLGLLDLQQQARQAMHGMSRELRQSRDSEISIISDSQIIFSIPPQDYGSGWIGPISYYLDTLENQIIREYPAGTERIVANDVNGLIFSLNNNLLDIQLTCTKTVLQRDLAFSLNSQVRLRNE